MAQYLKIEIIGSIGSIILAILEVYLDSQVAGNDRPLYPKVDHYWFKVAHNYSPLYPKVDHYWFKVAHNYEPLALQAEACFEPFSWVNSRLAKTDYLGVLGPRPPNEESLRTAASTGLL